MKVQVTLTRKEIAESQKLIELLKDFEQLKNLRERGSRGKVHLYLDGNYGKAGYTASTIDQQSPSHPGGKMEQVAFDIDEAIGSAVKEAIEEAIKIIRAAIPFEVE